MLNHLDDPDGPELPTGFAERVRRRGRVLRRRRWLNGSAAIVLVAVMGAGAGLYARAFDSVGDVERLAVTGADGPADPADRTILVVGTDGHDEDESSTNRTDTILLVRLVDGGARVLSIPRDLLVEPASGEPIRINSVAPAFGYDGLIDVIESLLAIDVDNFIHVDMDGFAALVDLVGGLDVHFRAPSRDTRSGLDVSDTGCVRLEGDDALALTRSRVYEVLVDGRWITDPRGDLSRIDRQSVLVGAGLQALARTRPDPLTADRLASWLADHTAVDQSLADRELVTIASSIMAMNPSDVTFTVMAVEPRNLDGAQVLRAAETPQETVERWNQGPEDGPGDRGTSPDGPPASSISLCTPDEE